MHFDLVELSVPSSRDTAWINQTRFHPSMSTKVVLFLGCIHVVVEKWGECFPQLENAHKHHNWESGIST